MDMTTGEKIKYRRLLLGYTTRELADLIGVSQSNLSKWERGDVKTIKAPMLATLAKVLGVSPLWLMGLEEDPFSIGNVEPVPETKKVPLLGSIACGERCSRKKTGKAKSTVL